VRHLCACIGSPCMSQCVHGASMKQVRKLFKEVSRLLACSHGDGIDAASAEPSLRSSVPVRRVCLCRGSRPFLRRRHGSRHGG
jgi:hypothetical protein